MAGSTLKDMVKQGIPPEAFGFGRSQRQPAPNTPAPPANQKK